MSDEQWRRRERDAARPVRGVRRSAVPGRRSRRRHRSSDDTGERRLSFGPNDTGPLPHWTDPPTGEIPRMAPAASSDDDGDDDVDVWSSFTTESPIWRDDIDEDPSKDPSGGFPRDPSGSAIDRDLTGEVRADALSEPLSRPADRARSRSPSRRAASRAGSRSAPTRPASQRRPPPGRSRRGAAAPDRARAARPARRARRPSRHRRRATCRPRSAPASSSPRSSSSPRCGARSASSRSITIVLAIAGFEYFGKVTEKGYRPAVAPGLAACVAAPLAAYWVGDAGLPLVVAFAFIAGAVGFIGAAGVESGPLPNMAVTTMGVVWIGLLGSFAALILRWSNGDRRRQQHRHRHAVPRSCSASSPTTSAPSLVGSSIGKTPLRAWISPGKTLEGLIGGTLLTFLVLFVVGLTDRSDTWSTGHLLLLALVIAVFAPLGDLTESMFKRNLDVKDFGALVSGHGGVLDRFDAFLFVLPVAYYVTLVLEPWT